MTNESVINQGLFYLDWLMDHQAEFELLVMKSLGTNVSEKIEWSSVQADNKPIARELSKKVGSEDKTFEEQLDGANTETKDLYESLRTFCINLGDEIQEKQLKFYVAFKKIRNFLTVCILPQQNQIRMWLKVDPDSVKLEEGFSRDVRKIGHWGTGDLEVMVQTPSDFEKAKPLIEKAFQRS